MLPQSSVPTWFQNRFHGIRNHTSIWLVNLKYFGELLSKFWRQMFSHLELHTLSEQFFKYKGEIKTVLDVQDHRKFTFWASLTSEETSGYGSPKWKTRKEEETRSPDERGQEWYQLTVLFERVDHQRRAGHAAPEEIQDEINTIFSMVELLRGRHT